MGTQGRKSRWVTARIAWSVSVATGMATIAASLIPGEAATEAFETLRLATLLYAGIGAWDFVSVRGWRFGRAAVAGARGDGEWRRLGGGSFEAA